MTTRRSAAAHLTGAALMLFATTACGSDEPEVTPAPTSTTSEPVITAPEPDPTEVAEDAAVEAVERFYDTEEQAGASGDWSEAVWAPVAADAALADRVSLGADYMRDGWLFEGEIVVTDSVIDSVQLEPEPSVEVTSCVDRTGWLNLATGIPNDAVVLVTAVVQPTGGQWLVVETRSEGEPCEP